MIVRLMGEGQYEVPNAALSELNELDNAAVQAIEADNEPRLRTLLESIGALVRKRGERLDDTHLAGSDLIIPPADLSLEEARELFAGEGLIPDLPVRG